MSTSSVQFQTVHGRRNLPVSVALAPVAPLLMLAVGVATGKGFEDAYILISGVIAVEAVCLLWWWVRRNALGLFVGDDSVHVGLAVPGPMHARIDDSNRPTLVLHDKGGVDRIELRDSIAYSYRVPAISLSRRNSWLTPIAYRVPNHLLIRDASDGRGRGPWRQAGIAWDDDNTAEFLSYLQNQIDTRLSDVDLSHRADNSARPAAEPS